MWCCRVAGGASLVWTWFATGWTHATLAVPILLLPAVLGRRNDPVLWVATYVGATSVLLSLIGFLRWVFVVPPRARSSGTSNATRRQPGERRPSPDRHASTFATRPTVGPRPDRPGRRRDGLDRDEVPPIGLRS
jgi:hypothetical protein